MVTQLVDAETDISTSSQAQGAVYIALPMHYDTMKKKNYES